MIKEEEKKCFIVIIEKTNKQTKTNTTRFDRFFVWFFLKIIITKI